MQAIILSAGQGSRLLPLTEATPKCLLPLGEETILSLQIRELAAAGIREITVVTGFRAAAVESELARLARPSLTLKTIFNPFHGVADNLGSCWLAREAMLRGDFLLVNGDTLFERAIPARLLQANGYPVTLTIDQKDEYDSDDMKVAVDGQRLVEVGKRLNSERVDGESIGMSRYQGEGGRLFTDALEHLMRAGIGVRSWYLKAIDLRRSAAWSACSAFAGCAGARSTSRTTWPGHGACSPAGPNAPRLGPSRCRRRGSAAIVLGHGSALSRLRCRKRSPTSTSRAARLDHPAACRRAPERQDGRFRPRGERRSRPPPRHLGRPCPIRPGGARHAGSTRPARLRARKSAVASINSATASQR